jgi:2',3'-cyclic-nucleotide 2'-phosphodiesterase (5'-nucleotidase family)
MSLFLKRYFYLCLLLTFIVACKQHAYVTKVDTGVITLDSTSIRKQDSAALVLIEPFKEKMDATMNGVLAYSDQVMMKDVPEGMLNNFVADLVLQKANEFYKPEDNKKIDFCLLNNGGMRGALPKGAITLKNIFELMPFENTIVIVTLSGEKTLQLFNYIAKAGGEPISGFAMGIKDTTAVNIYINGKSFDVSKSYKIVTSDYSANGGDKMKFFDNPVKREDLTLKLRDAIIEYVKEENTKGNTLKAKLDKRIYYEK